jgi:hypothetical protein
MWNPFSVVSKIVKYFRSGKAANDFLEIASYVPKVAPYIDVVEQVLNVASPVAGVAVTKSWDLIKKEFPKLYDGSWETMTDSERKLYMLGAAGHLVKQEFPNLNTNLARLAIEAAFRDRELANKENV